MPVDVGEVPFAELRKFVERTFRQVADVKGLQFDVELGAGLPRRSSPTPSACSRCSGTCCPTRSSSPSGAG